MLFEVFGGDAGEDVDFEDLVQEGDPGLHGEVVVEPGVYLEQGWHVEFGLVWWEVAEVQVQIGEGE